MSNRPPFDFVRNDSVDKIAFTNEAITIAVASSHWSNVVVAAATNPRRRKYAYYKYSNLEGIGLIPPKPNIIV